MNNSVVQFLSSLVLNSSFFGAALHSTHKLVNFFALTQSSLERPSLVGTCLMRYKGSHTCSSGWHLDDGNGPSAMLETSWGPEQCICNYCQFTLKVFETASSTLCIRLLLLVTPKRGWSDRSTLHAQACRSCLDCVKVLQVWMLVISFPFIMGQYSDWELLSWGCHSHSHSKFRAACVVVQAHQLSAGVLLMILDSLRADSGDTLSKAIYALSGGVFLLSTPS